jgi:hypothetical protein
MPRRLLAVFLAACAAVPAAVSAAPHVRTGVCAGAGFGLESVSWSNPDGGRDVEGSGAVNARIGYAVKRDLVVGIEFWGWAKQYDIGTTAGDVPVDVQLSATTLCATYFPASAGFFIRLGAGLAYGRIETSPPSTVTTVPAASESDAGFAVNLAPGYEWRISRHFALGAQGDVVYLGLQDGLENAFGYGINAQFNWYW